MQSHLIIWLCLSRSSPSPTPPLPRLDFEACCIALGTVTALDALAPLGLPMLQVAVAHSRSPAVRAGPLQVNVSEKGCFPILKLMPGRFMKMYPLLAQGVKYNFPTQKILRKPWESDKFS